MMHLQTIARKKWIKITAAVIAVLSLVGIIVIGPSLWTTFVVVGFQPWNIRVHSYEEITEMARLDPMRREVHLYGDHKSVISLFKRAGEMDEGSEPKYLLFDRDGFLMRQHACYESCPGFIDSARKLRGWYTLDTTIRFPSCITGMRELFSKKLYTPDTSNKPDYTVLFGWDDYFRHGQRKLDSFLLSVHTKPYTTRVLLINTNGKDSSFAVNHHVNNH
ncbi:MAG: hypothetical protein RL156_1577 [Bacteroidota bacterium]|jgi:hypothetical protein